MKRVKTSYACTSVTPEVKQHTAEFSVALQGLGVPIKTVLLALSETNYSPSERTLREHMASIKSNENVVSNSKASGRQSHLKSEEWEVVAGWILSQSSPVDFARTIDWIGAKLLVCVSKSTISRVLRKFGLSVQLTGQRGMRSSTFDEYALGYFKLLCELNVVGLFSFDKPKVLCFDFVTNSYRLDLETTIGLVGENQQKFNKGKPTFTESYMVPAAMAPGLDLKPIMLTHYKVFAVDGPRAAGWKSGVRSLVSSARRSCLGSHQRSTARRVKLRSRISKQ